MRWNKIKWIALAILVLSFLGFSDATYLTVKHYSGEGVVCSVVAGCDEVLTSDYATVGSTGIPISLLGAFYYLVLFLASVAYVDRKNINIFKSLAYFSVIGFLFSLGLFYLQAFVIEAFCLYCLVSAFTSTIIFALGIWGVKRQRSGVSV